MITRTFVFITMMAFLASCDSPSKSASLDIETINQDDPLEFSDKTDAYYLFKLANDSNQNSGFDAGKYSKTLAMCCLIGLPNRYPVNFMTEQRGVNFGKAFNLNDPLGWSNDIENGANITIHTDLGLIVLEYPQDPKTGIRDIVDVIQYSPSSYPNLNNKDFYTQLSTITVKCFSDAAAHYSDFISSTNQESTRKIGK